MDPFLLLFFLNWYFNYSKGDDTKFTLIMVVIIIPNTQQLFIVKWVTSFYILYTFLLFNYIFTKTTIIFTCKL